MRSMFSYPKAAMERAMKVQEVILRAMAKRITWWQAAEIVSISDRWMRRWRERYQEFGYDGLFDKRRGKASPRRVPMALAEQVLQFYREKYFDLNVLHFHQKLVEEHGIRLSYTWVKLALQGAGLVARERKRGVHRKRRQRRPLPGMLLHIDGSRHRWFQDERWYDLIVILDGRHQRDLLRAVGGGRIDGNGDGSAARGGRAPGAILRFVQRSRQPLLADSERGIRMIPAYSPQARGRSERNFGTWQGRLPQELRLPGCTTLAQANRFLREHYLTEFNRRFRVAAAQRGSAFVPCPQRDLERVFSLQFERTVNRDNTVSFLNLRLQIEPVPWRGSLAGCSVTAHQHLDGTLSLSYGPHGVGRYDAAGMPLAAKASTELGRGRGTAPFPCNPIPKTSPAHLARAQL